MKNTLIISYDIANTKRLQKLSRAIEKIGMRIQYSVYLLTSVSQTQLFEVIETINEIIDAKEDDVRIYTMTKPGEFLGQATNLENPFIF